MVDTTANLKLEGSGSLSKYLEDLNKQMGSLNKVTIVQEKSFTKLNKAGEDTTKFTKDLVEQVKNIYEFTNKLNRGSRDTFSFIKDTGQATIDLNDNLTSATKGLSGLGLRLIGFRDEATALNKAISPMAGHFRDIAEANGPTAKAFVVLDKTSRPIVNTLNLLSNQLEKFEMGLRNSEKIVAGFAQTTLDVGGRSLSVFSNVLSNLSTDLQKSGGLLGGFFAKSISATSTSLEKASKDIGKFSDQIKPEQFKQVDAAGESLALTFDNIGKGVDRLATGVRLADFVGDVTRASESVKQSAYDIGTTATDAVTGFGGAAKIAIPAYFALNTKFQIAGQSAAALGKVLKNNLLSSLGGIASKLGDISVAAGSFVALTSGAADAYIQSKGLTDTFQVMQNLGIDTTAASIAFQFGLVGEKLLLSSQAAKEFGKTAITAFAQLEDASAFVTTIGAGASVQFEDLEAGVDSISAAMTNLVGGPLRNAISSTEAANALYNALSAGVGIAADGTVNLAETNEFLAASLKLAAGSGSNAAQTLELLAKTSQVYGISNSEAADTAAKLYQIVEQGIVTFPQLTSELGSVFSVAKSVGVSMEEAGGSVAALTKVMSAAEATTGFQSLLGAIAGQGAQAEKALQELGVRFDVNTIKSKGLITALNDLYTATGGNAAQLKEIIPDQLAFRTALTLMTSASEDAAQTTERLAGAGEEALDELFDKRQQSTIQQFSLIMNGFNEVLVDFGRRALPAIQPGIDFLNTLLNILQNLPDPIKNAIGAIVLAQTAISNIGGGLLSFGLTITQVVAGLIGFRLASKLLGGQLGKEFEVLKAINAQGFDFANTLTRLIGLNEKFDAETAKANATLNQQKQLLKDFNRNQINFEGDISNVKDLEKALKDVKFQIAKLKSSGKDRTDKDLFDKELKSLTRLERKIAGVIAKTSGTRSDIFAKLQKTIDTALSNVELDLDKRREAVKKSLDNYLTTFGEFGSRAKTELDSIFKEIISDSSLSTEEKVGKINDRFKELGQDVPDNVQKQFRKIEEELVEAVQRMDGSFGGELSKVQVRIQNFFSNLANSDQGQRIKTTLAELGSDIKVGLERVAVTSAELTEKIENEFNNVLGDATLNVKQKTEKIQNYFKNIVANAPQEIRDDLFEIESSMVMTLAIIENNTKQSIKQTAKNFNLDIAANKFKAGIEKITGLTSELKEKVTSNFENLLNDANLTTEQKVEKINALFDRLAENAPMSVQRSLIEAEAKIIAGINGIDSKLEQLPEIFDAVLTNTKITVKEKTELISQTLSGLASGSKENIGVELKKIQALYDSVLNNTALTVEEKTTIIKNKFANIIGQAPEQAKVALTKLEAAFTTSLVAAEATVDKSLTAIKNDFEDNVWDTTNIEEALYEFEEAIDKHSSQINTKFAEISDPWVESKVQKNLNSLVTVAVSTTDKLQNLGASVVEKVNQRLGRVADPATQQQAEKNLNNFRQAIRKNLEKTESEVKQQVSMINNQLEKVGENAEKSTNRAGRAFGSLGDLVGNFVPGVDMFINVFRDGADAVGDFSEAFPKLKTKFGNTLNYITKLDLNTGLLNKNLLKTGSSSKMASGGLGLLGKATKGLGGGFTFLTGAINAVGASIGGLIATIGTFIALAGIFVAGLYVLHNALKMLIPAYAQATDANAKFAKSVRGGFNDIDESTEKINKLTGALDELALVSPTALSQFRTDAEKASLADLSDDAISELTGATESQIRTLRNEVLDAITPDEKAFVQGWRGPLLTVLESVSNFVVRVGSEFLKLPKRLAKVGVDAVGAIGERIPLVGRFFDRVSDSMSKSLFELEKNQKEFEKKNRNFFNNLRENIQSGIAGPARKAALESRKEIEELIFSTDKLKYAYERGGVAFVESQEKVKQAAQEQRALRGQELQEILSNEQKVNEQARVEIQKTIEKKQEELENAKDPKVREELESQISALQNRNTELEKGLELQRQYINNVNSILNARDENRAGTGQEQLIERVGQLYTDLTDEAKEKFRSFGDVVIDESGKVTDVTANITNSAQRRAEAGFQAAKASFAQLLADADDPTKQVNTDAIATNLFNALEAVDKKVAEGSISFEAGEKLKEQFKNTTIEIVDETTGAVQTLLAKEALRPNEIQALFENQLEGLRKVSDRRIKDKENEVANINALEKQNIISGVEAARELEDANAEIGQERIKLEEDVLKRIENEYEKGSEQYIQQVRVVEQTRNEIAVQGFEDRKKVLDEELSALQLQKDNELKVIEQAATREQAANDLRTKALNLDQQALSAQADLAGAINNLQITQLQNRVKLTGDIVEKAEAQYDVAKAQLNVLEQEQEFERQNVMLAQELNKLALENEQIQLRTAKAQIESNLAIAQAKLAQADALNLTEEETTALELQVSAYQDQLKLNGQQQDQLTRQGQVQDQINQKQLQSLNIRQQAARETSAADVEVAQLEIVLAQYEKQKQQIENNAKAAEISGQERIRQLEQQSAILENQNKILEKQADVIQKTNDLANSYYSMAQQQATNSFRQRRLEKEAAEQRLKNLESIQKLEQINLQIQQQQRDLALVRKEIELEVAEIKAQSEVAAAQAEQAKIEADPRASAEQRRAAALGVEAAQGNLAGVQQQRGLLAFERDFNRFVSAQEQLSQQQQQAFQTMEARGAVADTTIRRSDDMRISRESQIMAREFSGQIEGLVNQFQVQALSGGVGLGLSPNAIANANRLNFLSNPGNFISGQAQMQTLNSLNPQTATNQNAGANVNGTITLQVEIKGDKEVAAKIDEKMLNQKLYEGLDSLFQYSINKQRGV